MRTLLTSASLLAVLILGAVTAPAQDRPRYRRSTTAVVDLVDVPTRIVEIKRQEGYFVRLHVPETFAGLESITVGQTGRFTYNENVTLKMVKSGETDHNREPVAPPKTASDAHGSPDLIRKVTGTITAIDPKFGNVSFTEDNGRLYMARVEKPDVSKNFQVGDKVDMTFTQATLIELR